MDISICGAGMARSIASITCSSLAGKPVPPPPSSTARASKALKKGVFDRSAGLRCGKKDQGQEAPHSRRYARPADPRHRARRRHSGSRWRRTRHGDAIRSLSIPAEALRRWWLSRPLVSPRYGKNNGASKCRNRQAIRSREGLHRLTQAMGRRAHVRVAWTMPAPGQGLGKSQPPRPRIPTSRVDQAHAEKAMQSNMIFPDRLLEPPLAVPNQTSSFAGGYWLLRVDAEITAQVRCRTAVLISVTLYNCHIRSEPCTTARGR